MDQDLKKLISLISTTPDCEIFPPLGLPLINKSHRLPEDVKSFYEECGGLWLFRSSDYPCLIVPPKDFVLANPVIVGDLCEGDRSASWYIAANDGSNEYITIDLCQERLGHCYDSFFDRHAVSGSCPIIALSFFELLKRLYENKGEYWYWLSADFVSLGDAYDA